MKAPAILISALLFCSAHTAHALQASAPSSVADEVPARAQHAMVVSVHHLAADAGVQILKQGGNAVDAAVATGFALAVVHPVAGNLGGGGFLLLHRAAQGNKPARDTFIDFRETAPMAATRDMYLDGAGNVVPDASVTGYRSIAVPGSVAGLAYAEKHYGKLTLKQVIAPAIHLAAEGFTLSGEEARQLEDKDLTRFPESRRIFQRDGHLYSAGETLKQPELAATLRRLAANPDDFYHGALAQELVSAMKGGGGLITAQDLARYRVKERAPLTGYYHGYKIVSAPPPSSGGVALLESLNILDGFKLKGMGDRTPPEMQLILEAYRRAYMDRAQYLGDPDFARIPVEALTSAAYGAAWRKSIIPGHATPSAQLVRPKGFLPPPPGTTPAHPDSPDTTHYSVVDAQGNAVAVTTTLNNGFGSHVTAKGLGFLLNDEMDDFASKPGVPNMFGLVQGPNNAIGPGKRPLSSMTPTIVLERGKLRMVLGSPGGGMIPTTVADIFLSVADEGLNIQQAVDAPRFHHQYLPDKVSLEADFAPGVADALRAMGYTVEQGGHWSDGECIVVNPKTGELEGGQDHRHHFGAAVGY